MILSVSDKAGIADLAGQRVNWHSLPQPFYSDATVFEADLEAIFARNWIMLGFECEIATPGSYLAQTIGRTPVMVTRSAGGEVVGLLNTCRHRGAQICPDGSGRVGRLVCPYHQWSYQLDGRLIAARQMGPDFDPASHALRRIPVEVVAGCIYVCLSPEAPDFAPFRAALEPALLPHGLTNGKVVHTEVLAEQANWKLVMENGRECYHCAARHPQLRHAFAADIGEGQAFYDRQAETDFMDRMRQVGLGQPYLAGEWWQVGRIPMLPGVVSFALDGQSLVRRRLTDLAGGDVGSLRWAIEPNNFCHSSGDCAVMINAFPVSPTQTTVIAKWLVHKDAVEGVDYEMPRLIEMWDQTNRQDRDLAENNQRGVIGRGYVPGPYSPEAERFVNDFASWYVARVSDWAKASEG